MTSQDAKDLESLKDIKRALEDDNLEMVYAILNDWIKELENE